MIDGDTLVHNSMGLMETLYENLTKPTRGLDFHESYDHGRLFRFQDVGFEFLEDRLIEFARDLNETDEYNTLDIRSPPLPPKSEGLACRLCLSSIGFLVVYRFPLLRLEMLVDNHELKQFSRGV